MFIPRSTMQSSSGMLEQSAGRASAHVDAAQVLVLGPADALVIRCFGRAFHDRRNDDAIAGTGRRWPELGIFLLDGFAELASHVDVGELDVGIGDGGKRLATRRT